MTNDKNKDFENQNLVKFPSQPSKPLPPKSEEYNVVPPINESEIKIFEQKSSKPLPPKSEVHGIVPPINESEIKTEVKQEAEANIKSQDVSKTEIEVKERPKIVESAELSKEAEADRKELVEKAIKTGELNIIENFKQIESNFIDIGKTVLESGVFKGEEYTAVSELLGNFFNRYEDIAIIINAQIEQIKKIGADHIKDELPLTKLTEKVNVFGDKLSSYNLQSKSLLDSLVAIREIFPEKVIDNKSEAEKIIKSLLKTMNDFSLSHINTLDIDSATLPQTEKERLNIIFNVYDKDGFENTSKSFVKFEDYYRAEEDNLKNQELTLLSLYQKDKELEAQKPKNQVLLDENVKDLFLLKDVFDLNPELYNKVILNFKLLNEYKDDLEELQPYLKNKSGHYDLEHLQKIVRDLAKNDPGMILEYLENKLDDLTDAYNELLSVRAKKKPAEKVFNVEELKKVVNDVSQMAQSGEIEINKADALSDPIITQQIKNEPKLEVGEDADIVDEVTELGPEDYTLIEEDLPVKPKYSMPPLPAMETVKREEQQLETQRTKDIEALQNIELQRNNFAENFWKNNKALADKLSYYQIMYRELKNMVDARAGQEVLDNMGQNLRTNLNSYIKEHYGQTSEVEIIKGVSDLLAANDEKLQELYELLVKNKTKPLEQIPISPITKREVGEDEVIELEPEDYTLIEEDASAKPKYSMPSLPAMEKDPHLARYVDNQIKGIGYSWDNTLRLVARLREQGVSQVGEINLLADIFDKSKYNLPNVLYQYVSDQKITQENIDNIDNYLDEVKKMVISYQDILRKEIMSRKGEVIDLLTKLRDSAKAKHSKNEQKNLENQELTNMIAGAKSFDDLAEIIRNNKTEIQGSNHLYKTSDLLASIEAAQQGFSPQYWKATRGNGFREKLFTLSQEQQAKQIDEPEPIFLTEDMKKKPKLEPISLTEDMKKKEVRDWRNEAIVDATDRVLELDNLANQLGKKYRDQKNNLLEMNAIYTDLANSLSAPENLGIVKAWFMENLGITMNKQEDILNYFLNEIVQMENIKNSYQATRKLFSGGTASFNFRNAVDIALYNANDFVDQLNLWQETVYNKNKRPAPQLPKTQFPTMLHH